MQKSDNKQNTKSGFKTLLLSVILSSPGPLILGIGLTIGRSSTQISDFTRRSAELLAIIAAFVVYLITNRDNFDEDRRKKLEKKSNIFVGIIMCISGFSMIIMAFVSDTGDKGNVLPAFVIALFGVIANTLFWRKYSKLYSVEKNAILGVQARLYGAKSIVDTCVTLTLLVVAIWPGSTFSHYFDILGSILVSAYMLRCGIKTIFT